MMILIIIVSVIIFLILFIDFIIGINVYKKNKKINKLDNNIYSILAQQYDLIIILGNMLINSGISLSENILIDLNMHEGAIELSTIERLNIKNTVQKMTTDLISIADNSSLMNNDEYKAIKSSLMTFNCDYRKEIVLANQDIYAYNYWINFIVFKPFSKMFKLKKKDYIQ